MRRRWAAAGVRKPGDLIGGAVVGAQPHDLLHVLQAATEHIQQE